MIDPDDFLANLDQAAKGDEPEPPAPAPTAEPAARPLRAIRITDLRPDYDADGVPDAEEFAAELEAAGRALPSLLPETSDEPGAGFAPSPAPPDGSGPEAGRGLALEDASTGEPFTASDEAFAPLPPPEPRRGLLEFGLGRRRRREAAPEEPPSALPDFIADPTRPDPTATADLDALRERSGQTEIEADLALIYRDQAMREAAAHEASGGAESRESAEAQSKADEASMQAESARHDQLDALAAERERAVELRRELVAELAKVSSGHELLVAQRREIEAEIERIELEAIGETSLEVLRGALGEAQNQLAYYEATSEGLAAQESTLLAALARADTDARTAAATRARAEGEPAADRDEERSRLAIETARETELTERAAVELATLRLATAREARELALSTARRERAKALRLSQRIAALEAPAPSAGPDDLIDFDPRSLPAPEPGSIAPVVPVAPAAAGRAGISFAPPPGGPRETITIGSPVEPDGAGGFVARAPAPMPLFGSTEDPDSFLDAPATNPSFVPSSGPPSFEPSARPLFVADAPTDAPDELDALLGPGGAPTPRFVAADTPAPFGDWGAGEPAAPTPRKKRRRDSPSPPEQVDWAAAEAQAFAPRDEPPERGPIEEIGFIPFVAEDDPVASATGDLIRYSTPPSVERFRPMETLVGIGISAAIVMVIAFILLLFGPTVVGAIQGLVSNPASVLSTIDGLR